MLEAASVKSESRMTAWIWDVMNLILNVSSTVGIVLVNKLVLTTLPYPMALTLCHQIVSTILISIRMCRCAPQIKLPWYINWWAGILIIGCVYAQNLSLNINPVTFYQIAKLMNIPTQCLWQYLSQSKIYSIYVYASLLFLTLGIGLSLIAELNVATTIAGLIVAALAVFSVVLEQAELSRITKKYQIPSMDLLLSVAPQRIVLASMVVLANERGVFQDLQKVHVQIWGWIFLSCIFATLINISCLAIIGRFGPLTTAVVGHVKTASIVGLGFFMKPPALDFALAKNLTGIVIALTATIKYGQYTAFPEADCFARCRNRSHLTIEDGAENKLVSQRQVSPFPWDAVYSMKKVLSIFCVLLIICSLSLPIAMGLPVTMSAFDNFKPLRTFDS